MMESFGYDMEVITKAHPDMYCVDCKKLMREPVQFQCTHGICKPCYQRIFVAACKKDGMAQCPHCNKDIDDKQVNSNDMLHRMILTVRVKCSNSIYGCYWIGRIGDLKDHFEDCRHLIPKYKRPWRSKGKEEAAQIEKKMTACPYFPYGCTSNELSEKELKKHLAMNTKYHLDICTEFITKTHDHTKINSHQKYMADTLDDIFNSLDTVTTMVTNFEETRNNNMEVVRNVLVQPLLPFHELFEHSKEPEKFMPRVDGFVKSVREYVKKFDKKAFLELSFPCVADELYTANDYQCRKISVSDMFRFDKERLNDNYDKITKKLKSLKKTHYVYFVRARDVVKKLEKREECDLGLLITKEQRGGEQEEDEGGGEEGIGGESDVIEEEDEDGLERMQKSFENKVDSIIKILDDAVDTIRTSYREALLTFNNDETNKGHSYLDYYVWKIDASKLKADGETDSYYKTKGNKKEKGDCLTVWTTEENLDWTSKTSFNGGRIIVKYFVHAKKSNITARVFCLNQNEFDRTAPCQLSVTKVVDEVETSTFSITAEFSIDQLKDGCCVDDVIYFNTVVT